MTMLPFGSEGGQLTRENRWWEGDTNEEERQADGESELVNYGQCVKSGQMSRSDASCPEAGQLSVPDRQSRPSNCLDSRRTCPATSFFPLVGLQGSAVVAAAISWKVGRRQEKQQQQQEQRLDQVSGRDRC